MVNKGENIRNFVEAGRLPILDRGRSIKNSVSGCQVFHNFKIIILTNCVTIQYWIIFYRSHDNTCIFDMEETNMH
jgi:hypothetical protein